MQQLRRRRHVPQLLQAAQRARQRRRLRGAGAAGGRRRALIQGVLRTNCIDCGFNIMILPIRESAAAAAAHCSRVFCTESPQLEDETNAAPFCMERTPHLLLTACF